MPNRHDVREEDVNMTRLGSVLNMAYNRDIDNFEDLVMMKGVGPRTLKSLAMVSEVVHGDASRFEQLLAEYVLAPEVTRQRLYIDSLEDVMTSSSKILIDVEGGNNMLYLPLDQMIQRGATASGSVQELRDLANRIAPYLSAPSGTNAVDRSRLTTSGRGAR